MNVSLGLLGLLSTVDLHGYDLRQRYDRVLSPQRPIKPGHLYATLHRLERDGSIAIAAVEQDVGPERRRFRLTEQGREQLQEWLQKPEQPAPYLESALMAKVVVALLAGFPVLTLLEAQRAAHLQRMRELTNQRRGGSLQEVLLADFALFHLEADLRWLDLATARVQQLRDTVEERMDGLSIKTAENLPQQVKGAENEP